MSGFKDAEFSLDALRRAESHPGLSTESLGDFHHALLVEGCRERLSVCARLIEQRLAELEAEPPLLRQASSESDDHSFGSETGHREGDHP